MAERNPKVNGDFLRRTVARKRREVAAGRRARPEAALRARVERMDPARPWAPALAGATVRVIAEVKRSSPSAGPLAEGVDPVGRAGLYESAGAAAISVLTDAAFDGTLADLTEARAAVRIPVLRKDFLVDPWQAWESRAAGADAALLIVAALSDDALAALADAARAAGLGLLVEVHAPAEIERAAAVEPDVVGVNARNLTTFEVSREAARWTLRTARERLGDEAVLVAESGIDSAEAVRRAAEAGADAVLVGEHLMRAADPAAALEALVRVPA